MASNPKQIKLLKQLIWAYLILLLTEGALRKWVAPISVSNLLVVVRDPLVLAIYLVAMANGRFVINGFVIADLLLAMGAFCGSVITPNANLIVTLIGLRCYFLHLPLIFVIERTLDKEDIWQMAKFLLWFAIPETIIVAAQFAAPQTAWINLGLGGQVTEGFSGAMDKFRPSGTFSFTTGVGCFYPLVVAALLGLVLSRRKLPLYLSLGAAACVMLGIYTSINRTNAVTCAGVLLVGSLAVFALPQAPKQIVRLLLLLGVAALIASRLPRFDEGMEAFNSRWQSATGTDLSGFQSNIVMRFFNDLFPPLGLFTETPLVGYGVGSGTPMAQAYLTGNRMFALGESEWARLILEMGPMLSVGFIVLRLALCWQLVLASFSSLKKENIWPALFAVEAFFMVLNASWGQPTILGFATFTTGMVFAASRMTDEKADGKKTKRRSSRHRPSWKAPAYEPVSISGKPEELS